MFMAFHPTSAKVAGQHPLRSSGQEHSNISLTGLRKVKTVAGIHGVHGSFFQSFPRETRQRNGPASALQ